LVLDGVPLRMAGHDAPSFESSVKRTGNLSMGRRPLAPSGEQDPGVGVDRPAASVVAAEHVGQPEPRPFQTRGEPIQRQCPEGELEAAVDPAVAAPLDELLVEDGEAPARVLAYGFDELHG